MSYSWLDIAGAILLVWLGGILLYDPRLMLKKKVRATLFIPKELKTGRIVGALILLALIAVLWGPRVFIR